MKRTRLPDVLDLTPPDGRVTVVGDVHLTPERPDVAQRFLAFLDDTAEQGGLLVLLGDLFDWWVDRRQIGRQAFAAQIVERLRAVADAGVRLAFIPGNRDYGFDGADGLELEVWPDVVRTRFGERRVVLSHGDLLCSADRAYLRMRAFLRSWVMRTVQHRFPYDAVAYLARGIRDMSDRAVRRTPAANLGLDYKLVQAWLDGYEVDALVLGHVHTGVHHELPGTPPRDVYVLKDWSKRGNAVVFDGDDLRLVGL